MKKNARFIQQPRYTDARTCGDQLSCRHQQHPSLNQTRGAHKNISTCPQTNSKMQHASSFEWTTRTPFYREGAAFAHKDTHIEAQDSRGKSVDAHSERERTCLTRQSRGRFGGHHPDPAGPFPRLSLQGSVDAPARHSRLGFAPRVARSDSKPRQARWKMTQPLPKQATFLTDICADIAGRCPASKRAVP